MTEAVKQLFYLGNYQGAIAAGESLSVTDANVRIERDVLVYRAFVQQGRAQVVLDEIKPDSDSTALLAVRLLARAALASDDDDVLADLKRLLANAAAAQNPTLQVCAASIYEARGNLEDALRACHSCKTLEGKAKMAELYMRLDRPEHAEKEVRAMQAQEEEHPLTALTFARLLLWQGGAKRAQEAFGILEELQERHGATATLLRLAGAAHAICGRLDDAEQALKDALQKDPNSVETILSLGAVNAQQGKLQLANRSWLQAKQSAGHPLVAFFDKQEKEFDALCK